jgi:uroporphyrinogen III methyltransferase/synthase
VRGREIGELDQLKVCAIGEATAEKLRQSNIHVDVVPTEFKAEGVFAALTQFVGGSDRLQGLNLLIPRAAVARDFLPKALEEAGARVDVVPAYRTVVPENLDRGRLSAMLAGSADCIAFTSSSTVRNLGLLFDTHDLSEVLKGLTVACIGDITASTAGEYGLQVEIQPPQFTIPSLAKAIAEHYSR